MYVFDTSPLSAMFKSYYPTVFGQLWRNFDGLVADGHVCCTREVQREIEDSSITNMRDWATNNTDLFPVPSADEARFVTELFGVRHFQQNIEMQKILKGGRNADPFVVARAAVTGHAVVTMELLKPNAAKIPNICKHFGIRCITLESFMTEQGWVF